MLESVPTKSLFGALNPSCYVNEHWQESAEEIYERVAFRNVIGNDTRLQTSGVAYARKAHEMGAAATEKNDARQRVIDSLSRKHKRGKLRVLTMPGLEWAFEKALIARRDYAKLNKRVCPAWQTEIYAVEYDPAIYFGSLNWIPNRRKGITQLSPHALRTTHINLYYYTDVETLIKAPECPEVDAAWLDFTGYMTPRRLSAIKRFWQTKCTWQLTVTILNARYDSEVAARVRKHGGMCEWISETLGGRVTDCYRYFNEYSAMMQITMRK